MTNDVFVITNDMKARLTRARALVDKGKLELEKAKRAGLTDVVAKMEPQLKQADDNLRRLEAVYR